MAQDGVDLWDIAELSAKAQQSIDSALDEAAIVPQLRPRIERLEKGWRQKSRRKVGGRDKDRTCDPYDVNVVLYR
jgi:hypothetical protein